MGYRKENEVRYEACASRIVEAFLKYRHAVGKSEDVRLTFNGDYYRLASDGSFERLAPLREDIRKLEKDVEKLEALIDKKIDELTGKESDDAVLPEDLLSSVSLVFAIAEALPIEVFDEYCKWRHFGINRGGDLLTANLTVNNLVVDFMQGESTGEIYYEITDFKKETLESDIDSARRHLGKIIDAFADQPRPGKNYTVKKFNRVATESSEKATGKLEEKEVSLVDAFKKALESDDMDKLIDAAVVILKKNDPEELMECTKLLAPEIIQMIFG